MAKKTILITGHKGFIGSHLWDAFEKIGGLDLVGIDLKAKKDICDCRLPEADLCFHLAAAVDVNSPNIINDAETNIHGTLRILDRYREKTVFASTCAVHYPVSGYAISKLACEFYCQLYGARVVRLCNIYGEGGHGVHEKFAASNILYITGDGEQIRTFAPVAHAVRALIEAPTKNPGDVTILGGKDMTVNEVAAQHPDKPRTYIGRMPTDIVDGRQLCP